MRFREAGPIVLEPVVRIEVTAPSGATGDITGDLATRRGRVSGSQSLAGQRTRISALVPLAELDGLPVARQVTDRRRRQLHDGAEPLRSGPAAQAAGPDEGVQARGRRVGRTSCRAEARPAASLVFLNLYMN